MIHMINILAFQIHGGGIGGSFLANVANFLEFIESLSGKTPPEVFATVLPGIVDMDNIHPLFVHYPIAFISVFFLVDVIATLAKQPQWRYVASWLLYLGTVAALFTVIAGLFAADSVEHNEDVHELMERHEHFGIAVLSLGLFLSGWRLKKWGFNSITGNAIFLSLSGLLCLLLTLGADLGGLMVYQFGVSVKPAAVALSPETSNNAVSPETEPEKTQHIPGVSSGGHQHSGGGHSHTHGGHHHTH
ncbi:hypothetical protein MCAMS1_01906 [biofilm metagenome]